MFIDNDTFIYYALTGWVGGPHGKIIGSISCAMTESQIFSRPARYNSVKKHFIISLGDVEKMLNNYSPSKYPPLFTDTDRGE